MENEKEVKVEDVADVDGIEGQPDKKDEKEAPKPPYPALFGIDFGNQTISVAVAEQGGSIPFVVSNNISKHTTPSVVGFNNQQRLAGTDAASRASYDPLNCVTDLKAMLGIPFEDLKDACFHGLQIENNGGKSLITVKYCGEERKFRLEQILAILFKRAKEYANAKIKDVNHVVLSVPLSNSREQTKALLDAAKIAGLEVVSVVPEIAGVVALYGLKHPTESEDVKRVFGFVDVGHAQTDMVLAEFSKGKAKIISEASVPVGGRNFDDKLYEKFEKLLKEKHSVDVTTKAKYQVRLASACEKTKKVLSTLNQTNFIFSTPEKDISIPVSKIELESMCVDVLQAIDSCVKELVQKSGVKTDDIVLVEAIGGGTRIPCVDKALLTAFDKPRMSHTLDSSLATALGTASLGAIITPNFGHEYTVEYTKSHTDEELKGVGLTADELEKFIAEEAKMTEMDEILKKTSKMRNTLESYAFELKDNVSDPKFKECFDEENKTTLKTEIDALSLWLEDNEEVDYQTYKDKYDAFEASCKATAPKLFEKKAAIAIQKEKDAIAAAKHVPVAHLSADRPKSKKEKLKLAKSRKEHGNKLWVDLDFPGAARRYTQALALLSDIDDLTKEEKVTVKALQLSCHLNLSACYLKLKSPQRVIENGKKALELDKNNVKALYRRAQAYFNTKEYKLAKKDLVKATKLQPENKECAKLLKRVEHFAAVQRKKQRSAFGKMFS